MATFSQFCAFCRVTTSDVPLVGCFWHAGTVAMVPGLLSAAGHGTCQSAQEGYHGDIGV